MCALNKVINQPINRGSILNTCVCRGRKITRSKQMRLLNVLFLHQVSMACSLIGNVN